MARETVLTKARVASTLGKGEAEPTCWSPRGLPRVLTAKEAIPFPSIPGSLSRGPEVGQSSEHLRNKMIFNRIRYSSVYLISATLQAEVGESQNPESEGGPVFLGGC